MFSILKLSMKNLKLLLIFLIMISCTVTSSQDVLQTTTTSIPDIVDNNFLVKDFENLPSALVRIEVKSTKVELNEEFELATYEYEGTGSGFFISNDGYIITNNHVISGAVTIEVYTQYRSQPYSAKLIGLSECDDIAVLKIDIENANFLEYSKENPKLGEEIIAAGFPLGDKEVTYLDGIVSKKETDGSTSWASIDYAFEHTAEILPGSSGGPIVNKDVQVIGIAYAGNVDRQEFGIPINTVKKIIENIINKEFKYSFKANLEQFYGIGLYVYSVESDSSLRKVGLNGGEVITHIKGLDISQEETIKVYCDAINSRDVSSGITFKGVELENFEEINVEVSLDGSIAKNLDNIVAAENSSNSNTTTTTPKPTTTTTTTTIPYKVPDHNTSVESILMSYQDEILSLEVIIYSSREVSDIGTLVIGCLENETDQSCIDNTKKVQQIFDSHHPEASVGNGRFSACNTYHGLTIDESFTSLGNGRYKYYCKKAEFNHKDFILSQIDIDIKNGSAVRYNLTEVSSVSYGWKSDELSCFNNTKGWTVYSDGVPDGYTPSLGYQEGDFNTNEKSCLDINDSIKFNDIFYKDGSILYINR